MDAMAETPVAVHEPPSTSGALQLLALPPADATQITRRIAALRLPIIRAASIVVVDAMAKPSVTALAGIRAFLVRHPGASAIVVDRMDDAGCEYVVFDALRTRLTAAGISPELFVPAISSVGEGVVSGPDRVDWYRGPTLAQWLESLQVRPNAQYRGSLS